MHDTRYSSYTIRSKSIIAYNDMKFDITEAIQSVNVFLVIFGHVNEYLQLCVYSILKEANNHYSSIDDDNVDQRLQAKWNCER